MSFFIVVLINVQRIIKIKVLCSEERKLKSLNKNFIIKVVLQTNSILFQLIIEYLFYQQCKLYKNR